MAENLLDGPPNPKRAKLSSPGFSANDSTGEEGPERGLGGPWRSLSDTPEGECPRESRTRWRACGAPRSGGRSSPFPETSAGEGKFLGRLSWSPSGAAHTWVHSGFPELVDPPRLETQWYFQGEKVKWRLFYFAWRFHTPPSAAVCRHAWLSGGMTAKGKFDG